MPVKIFFCYAQEDKELQDQLATHLANWKQQGIISSWHDGDILSGMSQQKAIQQHLDSAQIILLLISSDFISSGFCDGIEMLRVLERHRVGQACVIPILLRSCDYEGMPFAKLRMLPSNKKPVSMWEDKDAAFHNILWEMRRIADPFFSKEKVSALRTDLPVLFQKPIWYVPFARNPYFTGREQVLSDLYKQFTRTMDSASCQVISGLGGMGKTQMCLEYVHRYRRGYQYVFWIQVNNVEPPTSFANLANMLNLLTKDEQDQGLAVAAIRGWLQSHNRWLLILDNVEDPTVVGQILTSNRTGHILLTSRSQLVFGTMQKFSLEGLSLEEGVLLLLRRCAVLALDDEVESISESDRRNAEAIVKMLGGLPLALVQAGIYIERTKCGLAGYIKRYQQSRARLLRDPHGRDEGYIDTVGTTWIRSIGRAQQVNPAAADLLRLCAFLRPDLIPEELITQNSNKLPSTLKKLVQNQQTFDDALTELFKYSLIQRDESRQTLSLHRMVQAVLRDEMTQEQQREWASCCLCLLCMAFPLANDSNWLVCERYLPHALEAVSWIEQWNLVLPEAELLLNHVGYYLYQRGQYSEMEPILQRALKIREQVLGTEHPETVVSLNNLAMLYMKQEKYASAESLYNRALTIRGKSLEPVHTDTASSLSNLAILYWMQGKYVEAEALYRRTLEIEKLTPRLGHPNVASPYFERGKDQEVKPLYKRMPEIYNRELKAESTRIFYVYAETDEMLRQELEKHLALLQRQGVLASWQESQAGALWEQERAQGLGEASLILLLVSADFAASDVCYQEQMQRALERERQGEVQVLPILVRPVEVTNAPFTHLPMVPTNGQAVTLWENQDAAWTHITESIRCVLEGKPLPVSQEKKEVIMSSTNNQQASYGQTIGEHNTANQPSTLPGHSTGSWMAEERQKIKVLFLAANPKSTSRLAIDEEMHAIEQKVRASEHREALVFQSAWAVRPDDLLQLLSQYRPHIVHFSGHGSSKGLSLAGNDGQDRLVTTRALKALLTTLKDNIQLVFLNSCYSEEQAKGVVEIIDCVIGMKESIHDTAAAVFASSFYRAIGFGRSVQEAFDHGIVSLLLEGIADEEIPELLVKEGVDAKKMVLISPQYP